ncbi:RICIN domain-containing protein [Streptacidiphilus sp. PAMC 29251]
MKLKTKSAVAATIGVVALATLTATGTAQAYNGTPAGSFGGYGSAYTIQSNWNGNCLDNSAQYGLRSYPCNSSSVSGGWQKWVVVNYNSGWVELKNANTGDCLDYSTGNGLREFPCNQSSFNSGYQAWTMVWRTAANGQSQQVLKNAAYNPAYCLDNSQYGPRGYSCNGASQDAGYQAWTIVPA